MKYVVPSGVATRLYAVAIVLSLAFAGVAIHAYVKLGGVKSVAERTRAERVVQLQRVAALELNVTRVSLQLRHAMLARTVEERDAALADIGRLRKAIEETKDDYHRIDPGPEGEALFDKLSPLIANFWKVGDSNLGLVRDGQRDAAFAFLVDQTIPARNALLTVLAETVAFQQRGLDQDIHAIGQQIGRTLVLLITMVVAAIVGVMWLSWFVARLLQRRIATARTVAERVRDGDLTRAVQDDSRDEFSPLLAAQQEMQAALARVVAHVRSNAESVSVASTQIAHGNLDLSHRTELQAGALQQASSTMDELGSTVTTNAESARHASELAQGASVVAARRGHVVGQVVETMQGINDSSKQIAEIIAVIDGIAFQTNILALNAAVEAARAGEQGRGFAVVAGEVRSLAQRSAESARQIKGLITASVARVEHGTALVGQAGDTMKEIVDAIGGVSKLVAEISAASADQTAGVRQFGVAVAQMEQGTQQNAALVEQSAAAAASLKTRADELVQAVAVFKLAPDHAASATRTSASSKGRLLAAPSVMAREAAPSGAN